MRHLRSSIVALLLALGLAACAVNMGGPKEIPTSVMAIRAAADATPGAVAASLSAFEADVAFIAGAVDSAWLAEVGAAVGLTLSGPMTAGGEALGFLAGEPLGDTTVTLAYDGGALPVHDALYEVDDERYLDLIMFGVDDGESVRPALSALVEYMASDVMNSAAVLIAVAVPSRAVGDSVARMLSPAYFDALGCEPGLAGAAGPGIRLFYGPEARVFCQGAGTESPGIGDVVRARLVLGRR